jgi:exodeoxyribonuclease VII large subunit
MHYTPRLTVAAALSMLRSMRQSSLFGFEQRTWSVAELTRYVRQMLESDFRLQDLWVAGEVSNVSRPSSGHLYFTLRDEEASLRCVMWQSEVAQQTYLPQAGEAFEVHGQISVYEAGGQYQLYADAFRPAGEGVLYQEFLRLKARLEAEGLFDTARKRSLPSWPKRIGLVTSPTAAALQDVLNVLRRRFPLVEVILAPTPVQGDDAPPGIVAALGALNQFSRPDLILLVRGGGSVEDLWAFNDENVARAIAASHAPVVTGIGHETDILIADFVADVRAPTPSAAAEVATPDRIALNEVVIEIRADLARGLREHIWQRRRFLTELQAALQLASPRARVVNARQQVDELLHRAFAAVRHGLALQRTAVTGLAQTLSAIGPIAVLDRGYAVVTHAEDMTIVRSVDQVTSGDALDVRVSDGSFMVEVNHSQDEALAAEDPKKDT